MTGIPIPKRLAVKCQLPNRGSHHVRRAIADFCEGITAPEIVVDLQLVASELVTNAFEHGGRGVVTLDLSLDGDMATLTVTSTGRSSDIPHPSLWSLPEPTEPTGRGLALTRAVSHTVELRTAVALFAPDWTAITAHFGPAGSTVDPAHTHAA